MTTGITDALTVRPADEPDPASPAKPETPVPPLPIPKPSRWKEWFVTVLLAALVGAVVASGFIVGVEVALGRFTPARSGEGGHGQPGNLEVTSNGDLLTQKGKLTVPAGGKVPVFYPKGYLNPPALTWKTESQNYFTVSKQTATGFEVTSNITQGWDFQWEATGVPDKGGEAAARKERKEEK